MTNLRPGRDGDWTDGQVDVTRLRNTSGPAMTAYSVHFEGTFVGYVAGRDGGWSEQEEEDPAIPVASAWSFGFAGPSRINAVNNLLFEARIAGVIPPRSA